MCASGKSSLLNAVLREERALTGPTPGLTRDAVAVEWTWGGRPVRLVDTAGNALKDDDHGLCDGRSNCLDSMDGEQQNFGSCFA